MSLGFENTQKNIEPRIEKVKLMRQKTLKLRRWTGINSTERQQDVSVRSEPMEAGREEVSAGLPHLAGSAALTEKRRQRATWPPGCPSGNSGFVWQHLHSAETKTVHRVMHAASSGATETGSASLVCAGCEHFKVMISHDITSCHANVRSPDLSPLDPLTLSVRSLWNGSLFCVHLAFPRSERTSARGTVSPGCVCARVNTQDIAIIVCLTEKWGNKLFWCALWRSGSPFSKTGLAAV